MSGALFSRVKTWSSTEDVTYSDLNAEFDNILQYFMPQYMDDYSANVSQMQSSVDPGEVGTESLATSTAGELQRLRHIITEITGKDEWYESPISSIAGLSNAVGTGLTNNRLVSGRVRGSGSNQPIFLVPNGAAKTVTLKGSTTNFLYYVNGTEYTISTDVTLTNLTAAAASNNTCLINDSLAAGDLYTKYAGEDGSVIPVDAMGSSITALIGTFAAFKLAGAATEYFIAYVKSSTELSKVQRGYFFDSTDTPVKRTTYSDNNVITLLKLTWVFAQTDGTLTATYNNPTWSKDTPTSPAAFDFWYDIANNTWKVYGVSSFSTANAHLVGVCAQDTSNTIAARSFEFFANYDATNTHELQYDTASAVKSRFPGATISVWGTTIKDDRNIRTWDMTLDLDSGVTENSSTFYFLYITDSGDVVISDIRPYDRREDLLGFYHPHNSWRCVGQLYNDGSSNIDAGLVNSYFSRYGQIPLRQDAAAAHIEVRDKIIRLSGATAAEYLPPAAKTKGQEFVIIHGGTSLTQVYTLTGNGAETIGSANTYGMYTAGETLKVFSDGAGYVILNHQATTPVASPGTITFGATTTPPTKGTAVTVDTVSWSRNGQFATVRYNYAQTSAGTAGTGDYLVTTPTGINIDTSLLTAYTGSVGTGLQSIGAAQVAVIPSTGCISLSTTIFTINSVIAYLYSTTQFRLTNIVSSSGSLSGGTFSSGFLALSGTLLSANFTITVPVTGWQP